MNLIHGDCLEEMVKLIENDVKIDLVLTDPPYGMTANKWDSLLDFNKVWNYIDELSTNKTTTLLFGSEPFSTHLRYSNLNDYKYDLYWVKNTSTGFVHAKNKPLKNIELISVFSKGVMNHKNLSDNRMTYNPQGLIPFNKEVTSGQNKFGRLYGWRKSQEDKYVREFTNYPKMVIHYDVVPRNKTVHPSQKPIDLLGYLISTYSDEGDVVLDFTMGSGSTGVACKELNRDFIGIELDENYYSIAKERIKNIQGRLV